jgi:DUF4097 and DUF4098 domain-containing protein YvlB
MQPRTVLAPFPLGLALALVSSACVINVPFHDDEMVVDGKRLEHHHEETLELPAWNAAGLTVQCASGDVSCEATEGPSRVVATVYEIRHGDACLVYEDGVLKAKSLSGEPTALGDLTLYVHGDLPNLAISTGMGDMCARDFGVIGALSLRTGMGDVSVTGVTTVGKAHLATGMGDVDDDRVHSERLTASSGMGDVSLRRVTTGDADVSSGLGDIELDGSAFNILDAETGLGDVECRASTYTQGHLETGLGSVDR